MGGGVNLEGGADGHDIFIIITLFNFEYKVGNINEGTGGICKEVMVVCEMIWVEGCVDGYPTCSRWIYLVLET